MTTDALEVILQFKEEEIAKNRLEPCPLQICRYAYPKNGVFFCCYGLRHLECYALKNLEEIKYQFNKRKQ